MSGIVLRSIPANASPGYEHRQKPSARKRRGVHLGVLRSEGVHGSRTQLPVVRSGGLPFGATWRISGTAGEVGLSLPELVSRQDDGTPMVVVSHYD